METSKSTLGEIAPVAGVVAVAGPVLFAIVIALVAGLRRVAR
jgi:hypothetical protein